MVSIQNSKDIDILRNKLRSLGMKDTDMPQLAAGSDGIVSVATHPDCDVVVTGKCLVLISDSFYFMYINKVT